MDPRLLITNVGFLIAIVVAFGLGVYVLFLSWRKSARFLFFLASPVFGGTEFIYSLILAGIASALIYRGLAFASRVEVGIVCVLLFLFIFMILAGLPHIQPAVYLVSKPENFFLAVFFYNNSAPHPDTVQDFLDRRRKIRLSRNTGSYCCCGNSV